MGNFINKHFRKSTCVKVILFDEGQKQTTHYVIPKKDGVVINGKRFLLNHEDHFLDAKRIVTFIYAHQNIEPLSPFNPTNIKNKADYDPKMLNAAIDSEVARQIIQASQKKIDTGMLLIVLAVFMMMGFGFLYYTFNEQLTQIINTLNEMRVTTP